jgi:hypothetical protein
MVPTPLTQSLTAGDREAFAALYDRLGVRLYRTALTMLASTAEAEDVVHDLFVDLARNRQKLARVADLDGYVFTMLRHAVGRRSHASEPANQAAAHPLGDRGQISLSDWAHGQERRRRVVRRPGSRRREDAVGDAGVQMHVAVEGRAEAVQEGDGPEPRAAGGGSLGCRCRACGSAEQSFDLIEKNLRESGDGLGPISEEAP